MKQEELKLRYGTPTRVWINAASTHNPYHEYNGMCGIAHQKINALGNVITIVYFPTGDLISISIDPLYLETKNSHSDIFKTKKA